MENIFIKPKTKNDNLIIAISTCYGGVSKDSYKYLNTALHVDDNKDDVIKNREILFEALRLDIKKSVFANQIHSNDVYIIDEKDIGKGHACSESAIETDGFITNIKNIPIVIQTADCLSVVLYAKDKHIIANIHCGWRGLSNNIIQNAIKKMMDNYNVDTKNIYAYLGASIKPTNFNVSKDIANQFHKPIEKNHSFYIDLPFEARLILKKYGITDIEDSKLDSYSNEFYSYRRDNKITGRMSTVAMLV